MNIEIFGDKVLSELDFHNEIARQFSVEGYYGKNLDALWDLLSSNVERPIHLMWYKANISREKIPSFDKIISIFEKVKIQDEQFKCDDKFTYTIHR